jgi:hypothetical protein
MSVLVGTGRSEVHTFSPAGTADDIRWTPSGPTPPPAEPAAKDLADVLVLRTRDLRAARAHEQIKHEMLQRALEIIAMQDVELTTLQASYYRLLDELRATRNPPVRATERRA